MGTTTRSIKPRLMKALIATAIALATSVVVVAPASAQFQALPGSENLQTGATATTNPPARPDRPAQSWRVVSPDILDALGAVLANGWLQAADTLGPSPGRLQPTGERSAAAIASELERTVLSDADTDAASEIMEACGAALDNAIAQGGILFASGSDRLTTQSAALLATIAEALALCPSAPVYVEGHTDSQGDARLNLALSAARAEAVVDGLLDLGISPDRLFAVGYGAGLPIASNDTAEGRQNNRRIVFAFEDAARGQGTP